MFIPGRNVQNSKDGRRPILMDLLLPYLSWSRERNISGKKEKVSHRLLSLIEQKAFQYFFYQATE